jgi:hypothetical protein
MPQVTLTLSDDLAQALTRQADRLPELLTQALMQPGVLAERRKYLNC